MSVDLQAAKPERGVSAVFWLLLATFGIAGGLLAAGNASGIAVFVFVFIGWIISLCLHEWGHAFVAWIGGDHGVTMRGYLTLNPLHYASPVLSIGLPLLFLAMGGIGFPGGAVYIRTEQLRSWFWRAATSAAGPAMNLLCLVAIGVLFRVTGAHGELDPDPLTAALGLLAFLQATALILNLLPIPGLDGFGILQAVLPIEARAFVARMSAPLMIAFLVVIIMSPQLLAPLWGAAIALCEFFYVGVKPIAYGLALFRFWEGPVDPLSGV